ncbi:MAG: hypothetical protein HQL44_12875 [Alphaproteobacteria bacterium]|nr:hypothetical protein [Alphaproteobacteria bacterium]
MIRLVTVFWMVLGLSGGVGIYLLKHEVQAMEASLAETRRQTFADQQAIHVLKAEWTFLNEPARLKALAERHLNMEPMSATQVAMIADLPRREVIGPQLPLPSSDPLPSAKIMPRPAAPVLDKPRMLPAAAQPPKPVLQVPSAGAAKTLQKQATPPPAQAPVLAGALQRPPELAEAR